MKKEVKKEIEDSFLKRFFIITCFFILATIFFITSVVFFSKTSLLYGFIFFLFGVMFNIFIFIKGGKIAIIFGSFFLALWIIIILISAIISLGLTKEISPEEQKAMIEGKKGITDNLFNSIDAGNYEGFLKNLDDKMKERYDKLTFLNMKNGMGKIILWDCPKAKKATGGFPVVICEVESENKRTSWDIRFDNTEKIWLLSISEILPNVTVEVKTKKVEKDIIVSQEGKSVQLNPPEGGIFLVFDVSIKNNEEKILRVHDFKFASKDYSFGQISDEYEPDCNLLRKVELKPGETKSGCLVFVGFEGYSEGEIIAI
ncbi:MAG: DUF4352 domain-containing protein [Nanoarchaeota archaeon]